MNYKAIGKILGKILITEGVLMIFPLVTSLIYHEDLIFQLSFAFPAIFLVIVGLILSKIKPNHRLYQRDGFALVGIAWIIMSIFGAIPFVINHDIPNFIDAFFEIASGFTTTGSTILTDVEVLSHSSLFWRSFSHWIGGMGILVFILIFIPESNDGTSMHMLKAESPGPQVGKLVSKMRASSQILYAIYFFLTAIEIVLLIVDPEMDLFSALTLSFGTAGTGGFSIWNVMVDHLSIYSTYVIATFMILFGVNFSLYYLILIGKFKQASKSEELRSYFIIIIVSIIIILISKLIQIGDFSAKIFEENFRESYFTVASIITTTGYSTADFNLYPVIAKVVIVFLMLSGAMAGSTGGGLKVSRLVIAFKGFILKMRRVVNPRYAGTANLDEKPLEDKEIDDIFFYLSLYAVVTVVVVIILSFDPIWYNGIGDAYNAFETNLTATISCLSNIGPGFSMVGSYGNFANYSPVSKLILAITMIIGRLEFYPILILFSLRTWRSRFKLTNK